MRLRFHRSFQLFPGVRLNLSKGGVSASFGVPGATVNMGPRGVQSTIGIPGTGVSFRQYHNAESLPQSAPASQPFPTGSPPPQPSYYQPFSAMREINSASVEELTSESLIELREMISQARSQRGSIETDLAEAEAELSRQSEELAKRQRSIFRIFYKRRIEALVTSVPEVEAEVERLQGWLDCTHITVQFETGPAAKRAYGALVRAFDDLRASTSVWDITSDRSTDRVIERTAATRTLLRIPVALDYASSDLIEFEGRATRFENANGEPILI